MQERRLRLRKMPVPLPASVFNLHPAKVFVLHDIIDHRNGKVLGRIGEVRPREKTDRPFVVLLLEKVGIRELKKMAQWKASLRPESGRPVKRKHASAP